MDGDSEHVSVRIEMEGSSLPASNAPAAPSANGSRLPLLGGLLALLSAAALLLLALPDRNDDELSSEPEPVAAPATTASPPTTLPTTTTAETVDDDVSGLQVADIGSSVQSIVAADRGWIALQNSDARSLEPRLQRSLDGLIWTEVDARFDIEPPSVGIREFSHLTSTDDGFAMIMTSVENPGPVAETTSTRVDRLVSAFGAVWTHDPDFEPIVEKGSFVQTLAHEGEWVQLVTWTDAEPGNAVVLDLLRAQVADPNRMDGVCWTVPVGDRVETIQCSTGEGISLRAEDFVDPEQFPAIRDCLVELNSTSAPLMSGFTFTVVGSDGSRRQLDDFARAVSLPVLLDTGTIVMVDAGSPPLDSGPCAGLVEGTATMDAGILVWEAAAAAPTRVSIDVGSVSGPSFATLRTAALVDEGIRVLVGDVVWQVDAGLESAQPVFDPDRSPSELAVLTPDGASTIQVSEGEITLYDLATGERAVLADGILPSTWLFPVHVANDSVFVDRNGSLHLLELAAP